MRIMMTTESFFSKFIIVFISFICLEKGVQSQKSFDGFSVLRMTPDTDGKVNFLKSLAYNFDTDVSFMDKVDFWRRPKGVNHSVDLMLAPDVQDDIRALLEENEVRHRIMVPNVQSLIQAEKASYEGDDLNYGRKDYIQDMNAFFQDYHRLNEIHDYMNDLAQMYAHRVKTKSIGKSHEGRDLLLWIIGNKSPDGRPKDIIWLDSGIHAREWISPATGLFLATHLIREADTNETIGNLLDMFDFHMLPVSNPDGYEHTHVNDRMWRKTRSRSGSGWDIVCRGTDPNRNWGFHWNEAGSSSHPCSDIYAGPSPFSEPETKAMSDYILKNKDKIFAYISLHSYSQLILTPWGWTKDLPKDYPDMERVALSAASALKSIYGTEYTVGSSTRVLYEAAGGSDDWAHGAAGIKYSYTVELRDTGEHGFVLPKEHIIPTGEESLLLLIDMAHSFALEKGLIKN